MLSLLSRARLATASIGASRSSTIRRAPMSPASSPVIPRKEFRATNSQDNATPVEESTRNDHFTNLPHDHPSRARYLYGSDGISHLPPPRAGNVDVQKEFVQPPKIKRVDIQQAVVTPLEVKQIDVQKELETKSELFTALPLYHIGREAKFERVPYWQNISRWKDVPENLWLDYSWGTAKNIQGKQKLYQFLTEVLPEKIPASENFPRINTRDEFIQDVMEGIDAAPMSIRLTPHILSCINWSDPLDDPLRRQFIPMKTSLQPDHPMLEMDSLHETEDSPVEGLVHRYTDKCLFLATSVCPLYCRYCTRSYAVGANTDTVTKASLKPKKARWEDMFNYIRNTPAINDVVISGGDSYLLTPPQLRLIGQTLLQIPHVRRIRFASKGLCVSPSRTLDPHDDWTNALIEVVRFGRTLGKPVALHTHFNHANEFSWVSREAAQRLCNEGVVVRNQSVLLRGVNDTVEAMEKLLRELADCNIIPYYVYQHDLVAGIEDLRTPLSTILSLERSLRGSIAGFMTPQFVVDLPGGGGKRLAASFESYDRETGKSTFTAPAVKGGSAVYEYWDPVASLGEKGKVMVGGLRK